MSKALVDDRAVRSAYSEATDVKLADMRARLVPTDCQTKDGYEFTRKGIAECREMRVAIEKRRKELKAYSLEYGRKVDAVAKTLTAAIEEIETPLIEAKRAVDEERERVKRESEEAERRKEEARLKAIRDAEEARLKAEAERLAAERRAFEEQQRAERAKIEEELAKEREAQRAARERADAEAAVERERLRIEREAMEAEQRKIAAEQARIRAEQMAKEAAERAAREERERIERERIEAEQREARRVALLPDRVKFREWLVAVRKAVDADVSLNDAEMLQQLSAARARMVSYITSSIALIGDARE